MAKIYPWLLLLPLYLFLGVMFYWAFQSFKGFPTEVVLSKINNPIVHAGQNIYSEGVFLRHGQCRINRSHFLWSNNKQIRIANDEYYIFPEKIPTTVQNVINIPIDVQPGEYHYIIQTTYFCNPMDWVYGHHRNVDYGMVTVIAPEPQVLRSEPSTIRTPGPTTQPTVPNQP